jgi:large subunit ribosomal protein L32e
MDEHIKELLKLKRKKPKFAMQDFHKKRRLKNKWKKPKGLDSKMRFMLRGYRGRISVGYKSPKIIFGLNKDGLKGILIKSANDLHNIKEKYEAAIISKKVGAKRRLDIIRLAQKMSIKIMNIKDVDDYIKKIEERIKKKKEQKKDKADKKEKSEAVSSDDLAKKIQKEEEKTEKEKKEEAKKEMDKLLIKKGSI